MSIVNVAENIIRLHNLGVHEDMIIRDVFHNDRSIEEDRQLSLEELAELRKVENRYLDELSDYFKTLNVEVLLEITALKYYGEGLFATYFQAIEHTQKMNLSKDLFVDILNRRVELGRLLSDGIKRL